MAAAGRAFSVALVALAVLCLLGALGWGFQHLSAAAQANSEAAVADAKAHVDRAIADFADTIHQPVYSLEALEQRNQAGDDASKAADQAMDRWSRLIDNPPEPLNTRADYLVSGAIWGGGFLVAALLFALAMAMNVMARQLAGAAVGDQMPEDPGPAPPTAEYTEKLRQIARDSGQP